MKRWRTDGFALRVVAAGLALLVVALAFGGPNVSRAESPSPAPAGFSREKLGRVGEYLRNEITTGKIPGHWGHAKFSCDRPNLRAWSFLCSWLPSKNSKNGTGRRGNASKVKRSIRQRLQAGLRFGEGGTTGGDDVGDAGEVNGDAVHLAFDEDGAAVVADGLAGFIEIEEDETLRIERRFGGVQIFGSGFVAGFERAGGEGDNAAALVGDGEHDALAEARVEGPGGAVFLVFPGEEAGGPEGFGVGLGLEALAEGGTQARVEVPELPDDGAT